MVCRPPFICTDGGLTGEMRGKGEKEQEMGSCFPACYPSLLQIFNANTLLQNFSGNFTNLTKCVCIQPPLFKKSAYHSDNCLAAMAFSLLLAGLPWAGMVV